MGGDRVVIELRDLTKRFGDHVAVAGLDLTVARGELLVLVGASGCGKTTTLKMINRLIEPTSGHVRIAGRDARESPAHELRRSVGYAFQRIGLFPHMTVAENVGVTPRLLGWDRGRVERRVEALLVLVELDADRYRDRFPAELSGGQRQRVGLARALAAEPEILLLDEPFGALDPPTRDRLQRWLGEVRARLDLTVVFVTHDMVEALVLGDRIAVMRAGSLVQVGSPAELIRAPADAYVSELLETPRRQTARIEHLLEPDGDR